MAKKELTCEMVLIDRVNGVERERKWDDIPPEEQKKVSVILMDNAMAAAGYTRVGA